MRAPKMQRIAMLVLAVTILAASWAVADSYKDSLIAKYPFYNTATGRFAPIYPALAKQIVQDFGVTEGLCIDVGGGCGDLSMELAKITKLQIYMLDIDPLAVRLASVRADEADLRGRVMPVEGDAQDMPFRDNYADLIVSRGSIFFWPDQLAGIKEIHRILKPGGVAYVGGGFSRILDPAIREPLVKWRHGQDNGMTEDSGWRMFTPETIFAAQKAGVKDIRVESEPGLKGHWLVIRKSAK